MLHFPGFVCSVQLKMFHFPGVFVLNATKNATQKGPQSPVDISELK